MSRGLLFGLWLPLAWVAPAAAAGALGWKSMWGSGSAASAMLLPLPIADGMLHLPSFLCVTALLATQPWSWRFGGYARALLFGGAIAGFAMLLDLGELAQALASDARLGLLHWRDNPLGLCILSDCLLAQFFVGAYGGRWPSGVQEWAGALVIGVVAPLGIASLWVQPDPRPIVKFYQAGSRPGPGRGDREHFVHTRVPVGASTFRSGASAFAASLDPRVDPHSEDVAVYFYESSEAASAQRADAVRATYCMYEDGKPPAWHTGAADCFTGHDAFSERLHAAYYAVPSGTPSQARHYVARVRTCELHRPIAMPAGRVDQNFSTVTCSGLAKLREEILAQNPGNAAVAKALGAAR